MTDKGLERAIKQAKEMAKFKPDGITNIYYREILKLFFMLENSDLSIVCSKDSMYHGWHLIVKSKYEKIICSIIEHDYSYGHEYDTLEIMGLLTPEESAKDDVVGELSAEDVFERISAWVQMHSED